MILEAFDRLSATGKPKFRLDLVGHSGESAEIPLVNVDALPANSGDRWKILEKMSLIAQYCWPGDETLNAINKAVDAVAETDAGQSSPLSKALLLLLNRSTQRHLTSWILLHR